MQVTAIVYGNPQWQREDGGCLRIWAPPGSQIADTAAETSAREASSEPKAEPEPFTAAIAPLSEASKLGGGGRETDTGAGVAGCAAPTGGRRGATADTCSSGARESSCQSGASFQCRFVGGEAVVDVEPLGGRLVLLLSGAVDHAVLPAKQQRVALTAWCQ